MFVVLQGKVVPWPADVEVMAAALRIWAPVTHCVMQGACTALFVLYPCVAHAMFVCCVSPPLHAMVSSGIAGSVTAMSCNMILDSHGDAMSL